MTNAFMNKERLILGSFFIVEDTNQNFSEEINYPVDNCHHVITGLIKNMKLLQKVGNK